MEIAVHHLQSLLSDIKQYFENTSEELVSYKPDPNKWSKKELLGHLIDSAINNLTRFTEINYLPIPYTYRPYDQDELVRINQYQLATTSELLQLWLLLNKQIIRVMKSSTVNQLQHKIQLIDGSIVDLRYLMTDYPCHIEHHFKQL